MIPTVVPSTLSHIAFLAPQLKPEDRDELFATNGQSILQTMMEAYRDSDHIWTILDSEGTPQGVFGLTLIDRHTGCPWMVSTSNIPLIKKEFIRQVPSYIDLMLAIRPTLVNYVDLRNTVSIRWLHTLGFSFTRIIQKYGYEKRPFVEFVKHV